MDNLIKVFASLGVLLLVGIILLAGQLISGWILMVSLGALGHIFDSSVLFISYFEAIIASLCLTFVGSFFGGN